MGKFSARAEQGGLEAEGFQTFAPLHLLMSLPALAMPLRNVRRTSNQAPIVRSDITPKAHLHINKGGEMGKQLAWLGSSLTIFYLLCLTWFTWGRLACLYTMPLNELGDFLAGAFGPLAILWLVFGFFQQGYELRQNSEALQLQAQELKNSVTQQAELVKVAQAQLEADKEAMRAQQEAIQEERAEAHRLAQPQFTFQQGSQWKFNGQELGFEVFISNTGPKQCTAYSAFFEGDTLPIHKSSKFKSGDRGDFKCIFDMSKIPMTTVLKINFMDANGLPGQQQFKVSVSKEEIKFSKI